jgi:hypothetical protein
LQFQQMATLAVDQQWPIELVHRTGVRREAKKTDVAETRCVIPPRRPTLYCVLRRCGLPFILVFRVTIDT